MNDDESDLWIDQYRALYLNADDPSSWPEASQITIDKQHAGLSSFQGVSTYGCASSTPISTGS